MIENQNLAVISVRLLEEEIRRGQVYVIQKYRARSGTDILV